MEDSESPQTLAALIEARYHDAARVWHPVALDLALYSDHLKRCIAASPEDAAPAAILERLCTSDLYLACAAGHGAAHASAACVRHFAPHIAAAVRTVAADPAFVDDVRQALHERLLIGDDGPPRILQYRGRASLASWLGVAAQRLALGMLRSDGARDRAAARARDEPLPFDLDPELQYLKDRYRDAFKQAVSTAFALLPDRQRTIIRLHTVAGFTLGRIGSMLMVDESTVSRWIQRARDDIFAHTQRVLCERLGIQISEMPSLARLITSQLDVSVARLLTEDFDSLPPATAVR